MQETFIRMIITYTEPAAIYDPKSGELIEGEQLVIVGKAMGDEKEYSFQLPITPDLPDTGTLERWQKDGALVVIASSGVRATSFQHQEKDDQGNVKKYPTPGKVYKVGNKAIEVGAMVLFQSYAIRQATPEDEERAKKAYGRYLEQQQASRQRSIGTRQAKAKERAKTRIAEAKAKKKAS